MFSHWLLRLTGIATLCLAVCGAASAQYGGGGGTSGSGGTGATGGYTPPSGGYSSGKAIGIGVGVAAGAAVGIVLLVRHHHHHSADKTETYVTGCTQSMQAGINLTDEKDNQTYSIVTNSKSLKAGERITLKGVLVASDGPGNPAFQMRSVIKDYGTCGTASASNSTAANTTSLN
jgi:hypothetical protein